MLLTFQLFDVVYREETLLNVIRSVTRNGRSIILTAVLALILVYMFSIIGYMFFKDDFLVSVDQDSVCKYLPVCSDLYELNWDTFIEVKC
jgi:inositol 1,4,5-triphosphate receptor type 1